MYKYIIYEYWIPVFTGMTHAKRKYVKKLSKLDEVQGAGMTTTGKIAETKPSEVG